MATLAPAAGRAPRPELPWVWRIQSFVSTYLPLLLIAFVAAATWWLVKNTPLAEEAGEVAPPRHIPDYQMKNFELQKVGSDGKLKARIEGTEMRHYPDTDTVEIDGIRLRAFSADGGLTTATARRALSNGDASELQLLGEVEVRRFDMGPNGQLQAQPRLQVRGEFLQAFVPTERLTSNQPVRLIHGGGEIVANGFDYDHARGQLRFTGRTTGRFEMPAGRIRKKDDKEGQR